jgi:serine/threonine protein kinase
VVKILGVFEDINNFYLVMDFVEGGNLLSLLNAKKFLPPTMIKTIARQLLSFVQFSHRKKIVHRDIKPENILVT